MGAGRQKVDRVNFDLNNLSEADLRRLASALTDDDVAELERLDQAASRKEILLRARDDLLTFTQVMMPHPDAPHDVTKSRYEPALHHKLIAEALEKVEAGEIQRLIITMPPRHGKSELATRNFPMWYMGRNPTKEIFLAGYSQQFAERAFGKKLQGLLLSERYQEIFPEVSFDGGSKAVDILLNTDGGQIVSTGRGGQITGMGAHLFVIDDPIKNEKEAESDIIRNDIWEWFLTTVDTRLYSDGAVIIVMTRWNEDDLVGRLTNPENQHYQADLAKDWHILHLPAIFEEEDRDVAKLLGKKVGDALWPEKTSRGMGGYDVAWLTRKQRQSEATFSALYQGRPAPLDGDLYRADWLIEYGPNELPNIETLNFYGASDHATGTRTRSDPSVIGCVGMDPNGVIWFMPDILWARVQTDKAVDEICAQMKRNDPFTWFIESENISKSFGPFLRKAMQEERLYRTVLQPMSVSQDKVKRSQSSRGLAAAGKFRFPRHAPWWSRAKKQLLTFPNGANDDFVDFVSLVGQGLLQMQPATALRVDEIPAEKIPFTLAWVKAQTRKQEMAELATQMRARRY